MKLMSDSDHGYLDEAGLPSYTHSNKLMAWLFWKRVKTALRLSQDLNNCSVLDFGCGCGVTFKYLDAFGCDITGCENQFIDTTRKVCGQLQINVKLCTSLSEISEAKFDRILALDVLEHVDSLDKYTQDLSSLLKPDGKLILSGPTENIIYSLGRKMAGFSGDFHVRNVYDIEKSLQRAGLKRTALKILPFPIPLFRISTWIKS